MRIHFIRPALKSRSWRTSDLLILLKNMFQITGSYFFEGLFRCKARPALVLALMCSNNALALPECEQPTLVLPAKKLIADTRPRIEWTPIADAKFYRIWIESRVPEGRVLFAQDVQTTASFWQSPQPLTDHKANVRLKVQANCGSAVQDHEKLKQLETRFRIDASMTCIMPDHPFIKITQLGIELSWGAMSDARTYEVAVFPAQSVGSRVIKAETARTSVRLERPATGIWTIGVRPRCANGYGAYRFQTLNVI